MSAAKKKAPGAVGAMLAELNAKQPAAQALPVEGAQPKQRPSTLKKFYPTKGPARIDPASCRPWAFADRMPWEFGHRTDLAKAFKEDGQLQPSVVRPLAVPEGDIRYEVIAGRVRWEAAMEAGTDLNVVIMQLDDRQAFKAMVDENEQRREICDYSKALRFREAINRQLYASQSEAAAAVGVSKATMSKLMRLIDLPRDVVEAFSSPSVLSIKLGVALIDAIQRGYSEQIKRDASRIESGEIRIIDIPTIWMDGPARVEPEATKEPLPNSKPRQREIAAKVVVKDASGRNLCVIKQTVRGATVLFPTIEALDDSLVAELRALIDRRLAP